MSDYQTAYVPGPAGPAYAGGGFWLRLVCWLRGEHLWGRIYRKPIERWARACRCCGREVRS